MNIPTPEECGLPDKFTSWRSKQEEAINVMVTSQKRMTAVCAATGFGKSPAYVAAAVISNKPTCIVTNSRGLQDQLMADFKPMGMVDIRGRRNYQCDMKPDYTCEEGYATRCPYKGTIGCPASQAEMRAATSSLVVTNYDKWCASRKFGMGMQHFTQVIFDEGHDAPDALSRSMQVMLHHREVNDNLKLDFPKYPDSEEFVNWKSWASNARAIAEVAMIAANARIAGLTDPKATWVKHYTHMRNLTRRLATLATANPREWIVDEVEGGFQFDPIRPGKYAEASLFFRVPRVIVVSATLRPKTMYMLGVGKDSFDFHEFDSDFDPALSPVYHIPTMRVDKNHPDLSMLWMRLDQVAARRQDRKGVVHTISYPRQREVTTVSRFSANMLINERGEPVTAAVDSFFESGPGAILVSPSVHTGFDFAGTKCEWQFLCKIPFPDSRSKIIQARQADDKEYGPYQAMQGLVQTIGRGTRFGPGSSKQYPKGDQCENFIGDDNLDWFMPRYGHLAPNSFHKFFKRVSVLPAPPPRLEA